LDALVWQDLCRVLREPALITYELARAQMGEWLPQALHARRQTLRDVLAQLEPNKLGSSIATSRR
jgi:site-specific DNA recombinase